MLNSLAFKQDELETALTDELNAREKADQLQLELTQLQEKREVGGSFKYFTLLLTSSFKGASKSRGESFSSKHRARV